MLNKLARHFSASQGATYPAPNPSSFKRSGDTTPPLSSTASPKKSTFRLSNDAGNDDPCASPAQSFKLRIAKIPRRVEASFGPSATSLATIDTIRTTSKSHYKALRKTENLLSDPTDNIKQKKL